MKKTEIIDFLQTEAQNDMSKKTKPEAEEQEQVKTEAPAEETAKADAKPATDWEAKYNDLNDRYLRMAAEYDNFRKRSARERDNIYADVKADTLLKFLPVYDNLLRALNTPTEDEAYKKGVEMTMNQFNTTMEKLGVTKIESLGAKFDPALHNAVMHGEDEIVEVFQEGFRLGDKVIRFAMVKVAN